MSHCCAGEKCSLCGKCWNCCPGHKRPDNYYGVLALSIGGGLATAWYIIHTVATKEAARQIAASPAATTVTPLTTGRRIGYGGRRIQS